jgi:hypothetical protein
MFAFEDASGAVRFLLWWLFLHRRLRTRQTRLSRSPKRRASGFAPDRVDHFPKALPVFIPATRGCRHSAGGFAPSKPFGFGSRAFGRSGIPLQLPRELCVTARVPLPGSGREPVSDLDCVSILHQPKTMSSRNYFNYSLITQQVTVAPVEKVRRALWIKLWKIAQWSSVVQFTKTANQRAHFSRLWKRNFK